MAPLLITLIVAIYVIYRVWRAVARPPIRTDDEPDEYEDEGW